MSNEIETKPASSGWAIALLVVGAIAAFVILALILLAALLLLA